MVDILVENYPKGVIFYFCFLSVWALIFDFGDRKQGCKMSIARQKIVGIASENCRYNDGNCRRITSEIIGMT